MKIIDQTPFYKDGEISLVDRAKAMMKFGSQWLAEVEAQKDVIAILEKVLDRNYTLLRNVTPPGLETSIPLILVGPPGVFVMYVTALTGMYRAKGDEWGAISGNTFKPEKLNLLTRTERMARAVQVYLQRQGYMALTNVDAILVCANTGMYVDSVRPIIRVVMRDAIERLAVSISQARVLFSPEMVREIVHRLQTAPKPSTSEAGEPTPETGGLLPAAAPQAEEGYTPAFFQPEEPAAETAEADLRRFAPQFEDYAIPSTNEEPTQQTGPLSSATQPTAPVRRQRAALQRKQWAFLIGMFLFWCALVAVFA